MSDIKNKTTKAKRNSNDGFIVNESYAGIKNLSDIFADLLYAAYCKNEPEIMGNEINLDGCLPDRTGHDSHAAV